MATYEVFPPRIGGNDLSSSGHAHLAHESRSLSHCEYEASFEHQIELLGHRQLAYGHALCDSSALYAFVSIPCNNLSRLFGIGAFKDMSIESGKRMVDERFSELY